MPKGCRHRCWWLRGMQVHVLRNTHWVIMAYLRGKIPTSVYRATDLKLGYKKGPLDDDAWLAAQTAELVALSQKTNHAALLRHAKELSGGLDCHLDDEDTLGRRQMGGMHIHLQLMFEDGTVWLVRILRERHTSFDDELSNQIILSECATLRWLESLDVPTPRLHGYGLRGDPRNEVGVAYMMIDKLPGQPFDPWVASKKVKGAGPMG